VLTARRKLLYSLNATCGQQAATTYQAHADLACSLRLKSLQNKAAMRRRAAMASAGAVWLVLLALLPLAAAAGPEPGYK